jgi:hypothetical protein
MLQTVSHMRQAMPQARKATQKLRVSTGSMRERPIPLRSARPARTPLETSMPAGILETCSRVTAKNIKHPMKAAISQQRPAAMAVCRRDQRGAELMAVVAGRVASVGPQPAANAAKPPMTVPAKHAATRPAMSGSIETRPDGGERDMRGESDKHRIFSRFKGRKRRTPLVALPPVLRVLKLGVGGGAGDGRARMLWIWEVCVRGVHRRRMSLRRLMYFGSDS